MKSQEKKYDTALSHIVALSHITPSMYDMRDKVRHMYDTTVSYLIINKNQ